MKRLIIIVEGETELEFVNRLLIPYLVERGLNTHIQGIAICMSGGGHGFNNIEHFKNTIRPLLSNADMPIITSMIDHYGINSEQKLPGYVECVRQADVETRIVMMESKLNEAVQAIKPYRFFIPYIQRHEMETLLFSYPESGFDLEDEKIKNAVLDICAEFDSVEDINCTPQGAPSKRLERVFKENNKRYNKGADAVDIAELTGITSMIEKCVHFQIWIATIVETVLAS
jgi:hypothetical protein